MVVVTPSVRVRALEPPYPSFVLAVSEMERESDFGRQFRRATVSSPPSRPVLHHTSPDSEASPSPRPILQHSHSLKRVLTRSDMLPNSCPSTPTAARPALDLKRSTRPAFRRSWGPQEGAKLRQRSVSAPPKFTPPPKPSGATVLKVLFVDWCVSVKDKCKGIV